MIDIEKEILKKFPKVDKRAPVIKKSLFKVAKKLIHEDKINEFLQSANHLEGFDFVEAVLEFFNFDFSYSNNEILNIPSNGRVVIIANHPLGALDALCLLKLVSMVRNDVRIVANDFLAGFEGLESLFIKVDNFKSRQNKANIQKIYDTLNNEEAVIIFPAGEVSRVTPKGVRDGKWQKGFLKFAKRTHSPILPILVDAKNSKTFYTLSILNKTFSTILLSDEMFKKQNKSIAMKIGRLIPYENIEPQGLDSDYLANTYKKHLYALKKGKREYFVTQNPIAHPEDRQKLKKELKASQVLGETKDGKKIYLYHYKSDSIVLKEIGRLREISFRKVQEGINEKRDRDKYDKYYEHIVLWDEEDLEIVGAYRVGDTQKIIKEHGLAALYTTTLFDFKQEFIDRYLDSSIELGRSFVQPKYWGSRALDYLWFGIGAYLKNNPQIKYMFGPVSLSASFPLEAKNMITHFYSKYFGTQDTLVDAKIPFIPKFDEFETSFGWEDYKEDFKTLRNMLSSFEVTVPTLYKQYSELTEEGGIKFCDFNIDPNFSDCIDGFIIVDIAKIKEDKRKRYMG
ncbi:MAG: lysophospholipid acyltransferase family protein [Campylobacterales bacterium]|nr:lysophospholipid acyltransferase family protein [Campylobacterales bacterium]